MKNNLVTRFFEIALCVVLLAPRAAVAENSVAEIETKIEATGLKFSKSDGGNFTFTFRENAGRTQLVVVNGSPESYMNADFVEIWSKAVSSENRPVTVSQMRALLDNREKTLGHWCLIRPSSPGKKMDTLLLHQASGVRHSCRVRSRHSHLLFHCGREGERFGRDG